MNVPSVKRRRRISPVFWTALFSLLFSGLFLCGVGGVITQATIVRMADNVRELLIFQHPQQTQLVCYPLLQYTCHNDQPLICPGSCELIRRRRLLPNSSGGSVVSSFGTVDLISRSDGGRMTAHYNSTNLVCFPMLTHTCANDQHRICPEDCLSQGQSLPSERRRRRKKRDKRQLPEVRR